MPAKKLIPAPIDRPLSRAYLRQFSGWSTAYPPGVSDPTSLRLMENVQINREGSVRIRPGLRYVSFRGDGDEDAIRENYQLVGSHETFFLDDGTKALLIAYRTTTVDPAAVHFAVLAYHDDDLDHPYQWMTLETAGFDLPADVDDYSFTAATTYVRYLQIDNKILALSNAGETLIVFHVGTDKKVVRPAAMTRPLWDDADHVIVRHPVFSWVSDPSLQDVMPAAETPGSATLISMTDADNIYNVAMFWTSFNEIGESAPSKVRKVKVARPWSGWYLGGTAYISPVPGIPEDPKEWADQLAGCIPYAAFGNCWLNESCLGWNLYAVAWGPEDPAPVEAFLVDTVTFDRENPDATTVSDAFQYYGFARMLSQTNAYSHTMAIPSESTLHNYSEPPTAAQGLVAADRVVLVRDPAAAAVVRWTSNQMGDYLNFTASRGGGYKTLTSGNMQLPSAVKLWQNPQSVDTLTILNDGEDGYSTGYYMAPATVTSQSEGTNVMGFEETTATPGTTSPYGCEVANNALYHPLDTQLMKSTAQNYNINHKSMTDQIQNQWVRLANKQRIVSCQHESRLYYLVHNPSGAELDSGAQGNEIWVMDIAAKTPTWSRWLIQGCSLRTLEVGGRVYMSVVRPDGVYVLDEDRGYDEFPHYAPLHEHWGHDGFDADELGDGVVPDPGDPGVPLDQHNFAWPVTYDIVMGTEGPNDIADITVVFAKGVDYVADLEVPWSYKSVDLGGADAGNGLATVVTEDADSITLSAHVYRGTTGLDGHLNGISFFTEIAAEPGGYYDINDTWDGTTGLLGANDWDTHRYWWGADVGSGPGGTNDPVGPVETGPQDYYVGDGFPDSDPAEYIYTEYTGHVDERAIPWLLETNTQGANRAHDAWCHLQQANIVVGNFQGRMNYGIRGRDLHGKTVQVEKVIRDQRSPGSEAYDLEDFLLIRRDLKEWFFFAGSVTEEGTVMRSFGQLSLVQYRYTPSTVNTGYEYGSVETFEYGRDVVAAVSGNTDNGIPLPYVDTTRP